MTKKGGGELRGGRLSLEERGGGGVRWEEGIIRTRMFAKIEGNV
jgi:hypothetical protein